MSAISSDAIVGKLMTNTWLDDKISPKYTKKTVLQFTISWKFTHKNYSDTITRNCTYKAMSFIDDTKVTYGLVSCSYSAGITDAGYVANNLSHYTFKQWGDMLSLLYLPYIQPSSTLTIEQILNNAKIAITSKSSYTGNLNVGEYTLSQIQSAISSLGTITVTNKSSLYSSKEDYYYVTNAGVEFGNNKMSGDGLPPSTINNYIQFEDNSTNRVITDTDFNTIFSGSPGSHWSKGVREDIDKFNIATLYPIIGDAYVTYVGPNSSSNITYPFQSYPLSRLTLIPPTLAGIYHWNANNGGGKLPIRVYLTANNSSNIISQMILYNNTREIFSANDIAWNYTNNKSLCASIHMAFFTRYFRNVNSGIGATLGESLENGLEMDKDCKIYPGDIYKRKPYITPSIRQNGTFMVYKISYLPFSDAIQKYKHPTMNRSLTTNDGLDSNEYGAVIPVVYIPSTIYVAGTGGVTSNINYNNSNGYPMLTITHGTISFYVNKYAYGNRSNVVGNNSSQRVLYSDIYDMDKFISQLNSKSRFSGSIKYTLVNNSGTSRDYNYTYYPTATFTASKDSNGYLKLTASLSKKENLSLYNGYLVKSTTISSVTVKMTTVGVDGFLLGTVSSTERTTDTETIVCSGGATSGGGGGGTGSGTSSASVASINEDGIDTADYTIGSFDDF